MEFVLSDAGQKLWNFRARVPGGPVAHCSAPPAHSASDIYTSANQMLMVDADEKPFELAQAFIYRPERTAHLFSVIRFLIRVICVEHAPRATPSLEHHGRF